MPGHTRNEAARNFIIPLQRAVSCITAASLVVPRDHYHDALYAWTIGEGDPVAISSLDGSRFWMSLGQQYRLIESERHPWRVTTVAYEYELMHERGYGIVSYHWHPHGVSPVTVPHLHLGHGSGVTRPELISGHVPTGRVSLEQFLRFLLDDFHIRPNKTAWRQILAQT